MSTKTEKTTEEKFKETECIKIDNFEDAYFILVRVERFLESKKIDVVGFESKRDIEEAISCIYTAIQDIEEL